MTTKISTLSTLQNMPPLAHLLPYWEFLDDCIVFVDGSLGAGFALKGVDSETVDDNEVNQQTLKLRTLLNNLPDRLSIQYLFEVHSDLGDLITAHEESAESSSHWLAKELTQQRVSHLKKAAAKEELRTSRLVAFLRYTPDKPAVRRFHFFETAKKFRQRTKHQHEVLLQEFSHIIQTWEENLRSAGLEGRRLTTDELRALIYAFLNPRRSKEFPLGLEQKQYQEQVFSPKELKVVPELALSSPREQLLFSDLSFNENALYLDGFYHKFITLKVTPEFTHAGCIESLLHLPFPFTLSLNIRVPEQSKELSALEQKRKIAHALSVSKNGQPRNLESEAKLQDTESLIQELLTTGQKIFYSQLTLILKSEDPNSLEQMARLTLTKFREINGAEGLVETIANLPLWKANLPGGGFPQVRSRRMKTDNLADFLPLYQSHGGCSRPICLFQNRRGGLVKYDPFSDELPNFSSLVTGSSGSGKSFLNNCILLQYLSQDPVVSIIDIGGSYRKLVESVGGKYLSVSLTKDYAINPFELPKGETKPSSRKIKSLLAILELIFSEEGGGDGKLLKLDRNLLEQAIIETYEKHTSPNPPTLSDFCSKLKASPEKSLQNFAKMLYSWTGERPYGQLLDRQNSLQAKTGVTCFDLNGLQAYPDLQGVMILIITDFILNQIEILPARRKLIIMDECWQFLKTPACVGFMEYCVRTLRKTGSGIVFITQGLDEIVKSPIASAILNNTANKFILQQRGDLALIQEQLKLNDYEMELIHSLQQKKGEYSEAFWISNDRHQVIRVAPTPLEYWIATTDASDSKLLREYQERYAGATKWQLLCKLAGEYPRGDR